MKDKTLLDEFAIMVMENLQIYTSPEQRAIIGYEHAKKIMRIRDKYLAEFLNEEYLLKDLAEDYKDKVVTKEEYLETKVELNKNCEEGSGIENVGILISKYKEQISLSEGLKKLYLEYRHDAKETLKKVNSLLEDSGLEFSVKGGNKTSLW